MVGIKNLGTEMKIAILGLGEAGSHFANDLAEMGIKVIGFDPKPMRQLHKNIILTKSNAEASKVADIIFSANSLPLTSFVGTSNARR